MFPLSAILLSVVPLVLSVVAQNSTNSTYIYQPVHNVSTINIQLSPGILAFNDSSNNITIPPVTQRLSYYVDDDGLAIIDGDVIFGTEDELLSWAVGGHNKRAVQTESHAGGIQRRSISIFPYSGNKWPGGVISYKWESQASKDERIVDWTEAVKRWTDRLPFLKFVEASTPDSTIVPNIVTLRSFHGTGGCSSPIGMSTSSTWNYIKLDDCGAGTYAHEIGHTLGLIHEQMRPDRDEYVEIHCENVSNDVDGTVAVCGSACEGLGCNFRKTSFIEADWAGAYDVLSLMHYSEYEFSKNGLPTLVPKTGIPAPLWHSLPTLSDSRRVCDVYWEDCRGVCGDGIFSPNNGEECDDGNNIDGDGCSANCKIETPTCPLETCDPTVGFNGCDISTSCISLTGAANAGAGEHMCACRHGFRADWTDPTDTSVQVRLPWAGQEGRVFVKPGIACNHLCDAFKLGKDGCKEVLEEPLCY